MTRGIVLALFVVALAGCPYSEVCDMSGDAYADLDVEVAHDDDTPILRYDGDLTGYSLDVYDEERRQEMWSVYVFTEEAQTTGNLNANNVIGSPIRYGDNSVFPDDVDATEALPLEDGRDYMLYLHRGCRFMGTNSANTIEGSFTYTAPTE
jgi:hypothetical protein